MLTLTGYQAIVRDAAGLYWAVRDTGNADLVHVWRGLELNSKTKQPKKASKPVLVRKAGCVLVHTL